MDQNRQEIDPHKYSQIFDKGVKAIESSNFNLFSISSVCVMK